MKMKEDSEKAGLKLNTLKTKRLASSPITPWQMDGKKIGNNDIFYFLGARITVDVACSYEIKNKQTNKQTKTLVPWKETCGKPRQGVKKQRLHFADNDLYSQSYDFSINHVQVQYLDWEEG